MWKDKRINIFERLAQNNGGMIKCQYVKIIQYQEILYVVRKSMMHILQQFGVGLLVKNV